MGDTHDEPDDAPPECAHCGLPAPPASAPGPAYCCLGCRIAHELARPGAPAGDVAAGAQMLRLGTGIFLAMNVMAWSSLFYSREVLGRGWSAHGPLGELFAYILLFVTTVIVVVLGFPLAALWLRAEPVLRTGQAPSQIPGIGGSSALRAPVPPKPPAPLPASGRSRRLGVLAPDSNALILVGVLAAYTLSAIHTFRGRGPLYYDTAAMILVLVTLGGYLESRAKRRATSAASDLLAEVPERAFREGPGGAVSEVDAALVLPGERVRVRPGEVVPVDGAVVSGRSLVDEMALTGESQPRAVEPGSMVVAGALCLDGMLSIEATAPASSRVVARVRQALEEARRQQPPIQRLADRLAAVFVPAVVALALAVFAVHAASGDAGRGILDGLSVLLVSCPCALGLAAPLAMWVALNRLAALGVIVDSAATLERAAAVGRVFLDKTGTLTGGAALAAIETAPGVDGRAALRTAAAVAAASVHPLARAVARAAAERGIEPGPASGARALPGRGVEAEVEGCMLWLGSERLMAELGRDTSAFPAAGEAGGEGLYLADEKQVIARFGLAERPRDDSADAVARFRRLGVAVEVLTGDAAGPAARLAGVLGVPVHGGLLPHDKLAHLSAARAAGRKGGIAAAGDGINDAPLLAAADLGFAVHGASALAARAGNVRLLGDRLRRIPDTLAVARSAMRAVKLNLAWSFGYNLIGVGLAAAGMLTPVFAASAMVLSSLFVVHVSRGAGRAAFAAARLAEEGA